MLIKHLTNVGEKVATVVTSRQRARGCEEDKCVTVRRLGGVTGTRAINTLEVSTRLMVTVLGPQRLQTSFDDGGAPRHSEKFSNRVRVSRTSHVQELLE
jgi:hypothetical protein